MQQNVVAKDILEGPPKTYKKGRVTIYTDASFDHKTKTGGWAFWLRADEDRVARWGPTPERADDANLCELYAIAKAIQYVATHFPKTRGVYVVSDSQTALVWARKPRRSWKRNPGKRKRVRDLAAQIRKMKHKGHFRWVKYRWVKGHQNKDSSTQAYLNWEADSMATRGRTEGPGGWAQKLTGSEWVFR